MMLSGDWLLSAAQWSMLALQEATLMVYDKGNNCQQYENEINKSTAEQGERNEGSGWEKEKKGLEKEKQIGEGGIKQERQREWSRHTEREKKSCRQM